MLSDDPDPYQSCELYAHVWWRGLTEEVHDALTGHEGGGEGRKYGLGFMVEFLAPAIEKIKWVDLD